MIKIKIRQYVKKKITKKQLYGDQIFELLMKFHKRCLFSDDLPPELFENLSIGYRFAIETNDRDRTFIERNRRKVRSKRNHKRP